MTFLGGNLLANIFKAIIKCSQIVDLVIEGIVLELFSYSYRIWTCWGYLEARVSVRQMEILEGQFFG